MRENLRRVREGDLDHLVFYLLQSTRFTTLAADRAGAQRPALVESPRSAASATQFLNEIEARRRAGASRGPLAHRRVRSGPRQAGRRCAAEIFPDLVSARRFRERRTWTAALGAEYLRAMRFVYQKEFVAQRTERPADAVADLYRTRGLSTDTAVEAGYLVHLGLAVAKGLQPDRRIRRVLIVGPGMDLAPRTGFRDAPPESYQPWAVIDALVSTGFARLDDLEVTAADINPRVVAHLRRSRTSPPTLSLTSEIAEKDGVSFSRDYRDYFAGLGAAAVGAGCGAACGRRSGRTSPQVRPCQRCRGQGSPRRAARHRHRAVRPGRRSIW